MTSSQSYAVILVGCGKMGGAMLKGWLADGLAPQSVLVIDPHAAALPDGVISAASIDDVAEGTTGDVVVLAIKPQVMADLLPAFGRLGAAGGVFLSVAAGKTISFIESLLGDGARVVRAMPNTPAAVGRGASGLFAGNGVSDAQKARCGEMLAVSGLVVWVENEALIDAVTAVSGSGPAYVFHLVEAMAQAGESLGLPAEVAQALARQTIVGAGELLHQSPDAASQLRINVTSPGGTTAAALEVLMNPDQGLSPLMARAMTACAQRAKELA
jgi:pyrroline-5-carboxylate reductase